MSKDKEDNELEFEFPDFTEDEGEMMDSFWDQE